MRWIHLPVLASVVLTTTLCAEETIVFSEGDFSPGSYSTEIIEGGLGGSSTVSLIADGGSPGPYLQIRHDIAAGAPPGDWCANWVWTLIWIDGAVLDPSGTGCISSIDYAISSLPIDSNTTVTQSQTLAIRQNGQIYISLGGFVTPEDGAWFEASFSGLTAEDFAGLVNLPPCNFGDSRLTPDFSPTASPIEFGFARGNSSGVGGNPISTFTTVGADSWSSTVHLGGGSCPADFDGSNSVAVNDLLQLLATWGPCAEVCCPEDLDADGHVAVTDLLALLSEWGSCPE